MDDSLLSPLQQQIYDVAASFGETPFTTAEFWDRFQRRYPNENRTSVQPADYCKNHGNAGNDNYPRFLRLISQKPKFQFVFVGL